MKANVQFCSTLHIVKKPSTHSALNADRVIGEEKSLRMYTREGYPAFRVGLGSKERRGFPVCKLSKRGRWVGFDMRNVRKRCLDST
jgi:hypothetical protein